MTEQNIIVLVGGFMLGSIFTVLAAIFIIKVLINRPKTIDKKLQDLSLQIETHMKKIHRKSRQ